MGISCAMSRPGSERDGSNIAKTWLRGEAPTLSQFSAVYLPKRKFCSQLLGQTISDVLLCIKATIPAAPQALQHEEKHQIGGSNVWHARDDRNAWSAARHGCLYWFSLH